MPIITDLGYNQKTKMKRDQSLSSMKRRIEYIYNKSTLINSTAVNIDSIDTIYNEFVNVKEQFNKKNKGNNFFHYVVSFSDKDTITTTDAMKIVSEFLEDEKFDGFQIFYGTHQDTDNMHCHLLINSVNMVNGKKWHISNNEWIPLQVKLNKIAMPYGCRVPEKIKNIMNFQENKRENTKKSKQEKNIYEQQMKLKNKSWKDKVKENVEYILKNSTSIEDFKSNLKNSGYELYKNKEKKYILKINQIQKRISLEKLNISEEEIQDRLKFNSKLDDKNINLMKKNMQNTQNMNTDNQLNSLKEKTKNYDYTNTKDDNRKIYYKNLVADINKFVKENKHLKQDYEKELAYILKYVLNQSNKIEDALNILKELNIDASFENDNIIINLNNTKISSQYLKIDIQEQLNSKPISWQYELYLELNNARKQAKNKEEFMQILKNKGIKTTWNENRQYITFEDKYGNKRRNNKIYPNEIWTKEKLEDTFEKNSQREERQRKRQEETQEMQNEWEAKIDAQQHVKSVIYDTLNYVLDIKNFEKILKENSINMFKDDKSRLYFEYEQYTFYKDKYFHIDEEYIKKRIDNNKNTLLSSVGCIFQKISAYNKNSTPFGINKALSSIVDKKHYVQELKKGRSISEKSRQR